LIAVDFFARGFIPALLSGAYLCVS